MPRAIEFKADAGAVKAERHRHGRHADPECRDAYGDKTRRSKLGPDRMMVARDHHFDGACRHLERADQGAKTDGGGKRQAAGLQNRQQVHRHRRGDHRGKRDGGGEHDHQRQGRIAHRRGFGVSFRFGSAAARWHPARQQREIERQSGKQLHRRVDEACAAPADLGHQEGGNRPADGAGEAAEQGQGGDRRTRAVAVQAAKRREGRVIEPCPHAEPDHEPRAHIGRKGRRRRQADLAGADADGAESKHIAAAMTFDRGADSRRDQAGDQKPERQAADHPSQRPTGLCGHFRRNDRRQIVGRAPRHDLRQPKHGDDRAAATHA